MVGHEQLANAAPDTVVSKCQPRYPLSEISELFDLAARTESLTARTEWSAEAEFGSGV